jgi:hypothetical protein
MVTEPKLEYYRKRWPAFTALRRGSLRHPLRRRRRLVGDAGNAPVRHFQRYFMTTDLQSARWIIALGGPAQAVVAGVGVAPTEAELMGLA